MSQPLVIQKQDRQKFIQESTFNKSLWKQRKDFAHTKSSNYYSSFVEFVIAHAVPRNPEGICVTSAFHHVVSVLILGQDFSIASSHCFLDSGRYPWVGAQQADGSFGHRLEILLMKGVCPRKC